MSRKTIELDEKLYEYLLRVSLREDSVQRELRERTAELPHAGMQIGPDQGQFMAFLAKLMGAKEYLEIGVFTGYSTLCVAAALPENGRVVACDISSEYTSIAQEFWRKAGVDKKIDLRLLPAEQTLDALLEAGNAATFDFAFIDADKVNYDVYYERTLRLVRTGALIAVDNVLWGGDVADPEKNDDDTVALRRLNEKIFGDERVDMCMTPIGDGLTLVRKR
ncbi:MAG: SAM-dependent methyltransferase [Candidatus Meridianibacter frigidus]|nr:MAG: SAM-dependent methyltransferase [Candidatus Eremiobacteraeota bacterium]